MLSKYKQEVRYMYRNRHLIDSRCSSRCDMTSIGPTQLYSYHTSHSYPSRLCLCHFTLLLL